MFCVRSVGTFARALDCSSSVKQPSLHMSAAAASRDITQVFECTICTFFYSFVHQLYIRNTSQMSFPVGSCYYKLITFLQPILCLYEFCMFLSSIRVSTFKESTPTPLQLTRKSLPLKKISILKKVCNLTPIPSVLYPPPYMLSDRPGYFARENIFFSSVSCFVCSTQK